MCDGFDTGIYQKWVSWVEHGAHGWAEASHYRQIANAGVAGNVGVQPAALYLPALDDAWLITEKHTAIAHAGCDVELIDDDV